MSDKIRVCVRVRPLMGTDGEVAWVAEENCVSEIGGKRRRFTVDAVFEESSRNEEVYELFGRDIVLDAMRGYHGALLAYGQTATGKTHSVQGTPKDPGLIPLAIEDCFAFIEEDSSNRDYALRVSYLEVYNETLIDLLATNKESVAPRIVEDAATGSKVSGCVEESVASLRDVFEVIVRGEAKRRVGETTQNARSSRSHAVLRLTIESTDVENNHRTWLATLSFCDLAGSERAQTSQEDSRKNNAKERLLRQKEGAYINKSLHALAHVVAKLSSQQYQHVPYRDSKLTRLLRPALGGNARVGVLCTCSPCDVEETANTLQFATRAKKITQIARRNSVVDAESQLAAYKKQVRDLKLKLAIFEQTKKAPSPTPSPRTQPIDEKKDLASAVLHLERLILRSGTSLSKDDDDFNHNDDDGEKPPVHLEPRFFSSSATRQTRRRRAPTRSLTVPPRALARSETKRIATLDDAVISEKSHEDNAAATKALPSTTTTTKSKERELAPQLLRIKEVIERVLTRGEWRTDNLIDTLKRSRDDTKFVLEQLDQTEGTYVLFSFHHHVLPRSRQQQTQGPNSPPHHRPSLARKRNTKAQGPHIPRRRNLLV